MVQECLKNLAKLASYPVALIVFTGGGCQKQSRTVESPNTPKDPFFKCSCHAEAHALISSATLDTRSLG